MALFEKDVEKKVLKFIEIKAGEFHSDVKIAELLEEEMDLTIEHSAVCHMRKCAGIKSGQVAKNEKERKIAIDAWNKYGTVQAVSKELDISVSSARAKLRHLHGKGLIEASILFREKGKHIDKLSNEAKRLIKKEKTQLSTALVNEFRQRKMDRVLELCDMRTL